MSVGRVYIRHLRQAGRCVSGSRTWFDARGWDWKDFAKNGRSIEDFEATGDPLAAEIAALARAEVAGG